MLSTMGQRLRLLANENIPLASVRELLKAGHDVVSVAELAPGIPDEEVLRIARQENRIIVTFDRDYGELIFRRRLRAPAGILYLRFLPTGPGEVAAYLSGLIGDGIGLEGRFTTADRSRVRQRRLDQ